MPNELQIMGYSLMKKLNVFFALLITGFFSPDLKAQPQKPLPRPNIILILADDLGYGDVGFNGQKLIKTPNIDRLAKEGIRFNQFYAGTSVCAPSRSSLMSGHHTGHAYIRGNKSVLPEGQQPIADTVVTVAEVLKKAGYSTAAYGKWGLGPVGSPGDPVNQGFDKFYGYNCQALAHRYYPEHLWDNDQKVVLEGNQKLRYAKEYAPDLIQKQALEFVDSKDGKQPFFLFLPFILPHAELMVPDDSIFHYYKGKFEEKPYRGDDYGFKAQEAGYASQDYPRATFAAMVTRLDIYVGQIMDKLKEKGLDKNTLVIFTSDNGPHVEGGADPVFFNSGAGLRGVKRDLYEGGIREPFVARWPGVIKPGTSSDYIGAFWDILPTFAELARAEAPANIDGISFTEALKGRPTQKKHDYLYWEFHEQGGRQAVRQDNWKAAGNPDGLVELYDLSKDPGETTNVTPKFPEKAKELGRIMNRAHVSSVLFPFGSLATN
jgi:arylsulfatase A